MEAHLAPLRHRSTTVCWGVVAEGQATRHEGWVFLPVVPLSAHLDTGSSLGLPGTRHWHPGRSLVEGHEDYQGSGTRDVPGGAQRAALLCWKRRWS